MTSVLLEVQDLAKHFAVKPSGLSKGLSKTVKAVDGVSFTIRRGETLALVGESGCGKSTAGRLILRLLEPTRGAVLFDGASVHGLKGDALRRFRAQAQLVFQDPYASLNPKLSVADAVGEPLWLHRKMSKRERRDTVEELLTMVGLMPAHASRFPHEFSGGQRQRIAIARAIASEPSLVVCDEAVSALDVSIRAQILNLLSDLKQRLHLAYIFISHDLGAVRFLADRVAVMYLGRIVEMGTAKDVLTSPRHPYTQALLAAAPSPRARNGARARMLPGDPPSPVAPPAGCALHPRCPYAREICAIERPELDAAEDGHSAACHFWREIEGGYDPPGPSPVSPALAKLIAAFQDTSKPQNSY
jgi:peptide/nickel transport system ATP-binding protein/oligopeptide transport system ATP-binding protein